MKRVAQHCSIVLKIAAVAICLNVTVQWTYAKPVLGYHWNQNHLASSDFQNPQSSQFT